MSCLSERRRRRTTALVTAAQLPADVTMPNRACFLFAFVALWKWSDMVLANEYDTSQGAQVVAFEP
eukprot:365663-Chlamydomonas_euryale.AAC.9